MQDRRGFFRELLKRYVAPAADFVEDQLETVTCQSRPLLRPPGALDEEAFLATCERCGRCGQACPADAILYLQGSSDDRAGTPHIDPLRQPCVVCDDLACMNVCPSGALLPVDRSEIRVGVAVWDGERCLRSAGEDCRICVDQCPLGEAAIGTEARGILVRTEGCVGCGVCEWACPTRPRAISVDHRKGDLGGAS